MDLTERVTEAGRLCKARLGDLQVSPTVLADEHASAIACVIAQMKLHGHEVCEWEPETIWLSTTEPLLPVNQSKILALLAAKTNAAPLTDWQAFGHAALALGGELTFPGDTPVPTPWQLAWAVIELSVYMAALGHDDVEFSPEVEAYIARLLHHEGYIVAPEGLELVQDELRDLVPPEMRSLEAAVQAARTTPSHDEAVRAQVSRLTDCADYVAARLDALITALQAGPASSRR